jgi:hypothetical protein
MKILNVGGGSKIIPLPWQYHNYDHVLLDVLPRPGVDIVGDFLAMDIHEEYDVVYSSHSLEHFYEHDVTNVLMKMKQALVHGGGVHIRVPDIKAVVTTMMTRGLDMEDVLYQSGVGPIMVQDVIYGHGGEIEEWGQSYGHKTGFTQNKLQKRLEFVGFTHVKVHRNTEGYELEAMGVKE